MILFVYLKLPQGLGVTRDFKRAMTVCNDLLRLSQNCPIRIDQLAEVKEGFERIGPVVSKNI